MNTRPPEGGHPPPKKLGRRGIRAHADTPETHIPGLTDRPRLSFDLVHAAARDRWQDILPALGIERERLTARHGPCPGCGGSDRYRFDDQEGRGTWFCSGGGEPSSGDGFALLCHVHGWTASEALHRVAEYLGMADPGTAPPPAPRPPAVPPPRADTADRQAKAAARAAADWAAAPPAPAEHPYLARKGIPPMLAKVAPAECRLTFRKGTHRRELCDPCADRCGCLLIPVLGPDGTMQAMERITPSGAKHFSGSTKGGWCAVQEGEPTAPVAVTEGFADAVSVALAAPTWRVLCAFSKDQLPAVAAMVRAADPDRTIYAAADPDPAGRAAAERAAAVARALPLLPPGPGDWDDCRRDNGLDSMRVALHDAEKVGANLASSVSILSNQQLSLSKPSRNPLDTGKVLSNEQDGVKPGSLITPGARGPQRLIDSEAAVKIAEALRDRLAFDADAVSWLLWSGTHWAPQGTPAAAEKLIADAVHVGTQPEGFRLAYLNGIMAIITRRGLLPPPPWPDGVVPFSNGLLDLETRELRRASPRYALDWCLPHAWDPAADCPTVRAWLAAAVEQDGPTVELLRAWLAALVRGVALQKFLLLIGRGGSGKGTFQRLAMAVVGLQNAAISTLRDLEDNRFETAKLYGKRLAMVNETGHHGGALNMLKAITGGDHLPLERKHVQQAGSFVFGGLVLMATNEQLTSSDTTSGLERRRVTVRFPRSATPVERADWHARGGEQAVLHAEIPGLFRWLLELSEADIRAAFEAPPPRVTADNLLGMAAGNSVADWLMDACIPGQSTGQEDDSFCVQIGIRKDIRASGTLVYEYADKWLYPNYLTWCDGAGRRPVALVKFGSTVVDIAEHLGHVVVRAQHPVRRTWFVYGLRLRQEWERPFDWVSGAREDSRGFERLPRGFREANPLIRDNREGERQNFVSTIARPAPACAHDCADAEVIE